MSATALLLAVLGFNPSALWSAPPSPEVKPAVRLDHEAAGDQDDLCIWRDPAEPSRSVVITSDKKANLVAVYDLRGALLQTLPIPKPGNIDIRQDVVCGDVSRDLVIVNQRAEGYKLVVLAVDGKSRKLERLDDGTLTTGPNYGMCLYHNRSRGAFYAITTSEDAAIEQYEICWQASGPTQKRVRTWKIGKAEAAVADDELGRLYISEEERGVWELSAEPDQATPGELVVSIGEHGLKPDLEGVALVGGRDGYLVVSSQSQNRFYVYERAEEHRFVGSFSISGAVETDGLDVRTESFGPDFPHGIFGCHSAANTPCDVLLTPWEKIAEQLSLKSR